MTDLDVRDIYGRPDFAFAWQFTNGRAIELCYLEKGLVVVLQAIPGRSNWTVTQMIMTYPMYLGNAVAARERTALDRASGVEDITRNYRVWARIERPSH